MDYFDKEYCIEVWGDMACFTRPELKVERVSYDVITPSAARAIFDAIFWKPAIKWQVTKIEVLSPIKWTSIRRNEVGAVGSLQKSQIFIEDARQQKNSLLLKDVRYRLYATLVYIPPRERKAESRAAGPDENQASIKPCLSVGLEKDNASINLIWALASSRHHSSSLKMMQRKSFSQ